MGSYKIIFFSLCTVLFIASSSRRIEGSLFLFPMKEASVCDLQAAFQHNRVNSRQLVQFYIANIQKLNPVLKAVIQVNPEALDLADKADQERKNKTSVTSLSLLHGIPVLVKDNISTKDKLNTTAGSCALLGSVVPQDAGVVKKLRKAGAIILGKASMTEWAAFRSDAMPSGWNCRLGQAVNPYVASADPSGSSTGSAISAAANLVTVTLGTETAGSILSPSNANSVVGIKPTVGLTSRAGVVPISHRQDTVGPICRTVSDAVHVLDVIVGYDPDDKQATNEASMYIPQGGYAQFLKADGLKGKRLGITRNNGLVGFNDDLETLKAYEQHFTTLRQRGAELVDNLKIPNFELLVHSVIAAQDIALKAEFKIDVNAYLGNLVESPVRSLEDVIAYNEKNADAEMIEKYGQNILVEAEETRGIGRLEREALVNITKACKDGFEKLMKDNNLDALMSPGSDVASILALGGYPGINVPAGYDKNGVPFGVSFGGLKGSEPKLIEIAYGFEQATMIRKAPPV
nr:putative amidase C869.01 [Ipomoea batatas]